ncbi:MAG TPA: amino acid adenylation domain-containing protein [Ktedonobacteraceae bacterium]|nr:amino acid adenylation domain-containing protein [Ktedonobacteraceae bacterium]
MAETPGGNVGNVEQRPSLQRILEEEWERLLVAWNATQATYPKEQCISQLFETQVERSPEAIALIFDGQELTYRELNERGNQLAHHLRRLGVEPEVHVGLCVERSPEMVIGLLGILKAGGAYVPLDPAYPAERLAFMLEDAEATVLVTQQRLRERLATSAKVVCLDTEWHKIAQESKENRAVNITGENIAYVMYTSGSTGEPKGVLGTHRAAINRFHWMWVTYPFEADEVCCQKTALSFVDSVWEIFGPLLKGIRTVIIPDEVVKNPEYLLHTLATQAVTRIVLVPSLLRLLLDTVDDLKSVLPNLKYCISSGEALPLDLALRFMNNMSHSTLLNLYGSSEVAADVTCYDTRDYNKSLLYIPIGRPIANTQIYLLDSQMQPVPVGQPGELYIGGEGLARGYFNRPELTAAKFVRNPFSSEPEARLYKTGDRARYLLDGNIEYLGRVDSQVKIRGFRIEPGEIEIVLSQHPAVREAVVVAHEGSPFISPEPKVRGASVVSNGERGRDPVLERPGTTTPDDKHLVAYMVLHKGQSVTVSDLRNQVKKALPAYMMPSAFVELEALPLTPNGKVDRRALQASNLARRHTLREPFVAPTSLVHHQLRHIWEELLDVRPIGMRDNFFYLGGHSLLATRLVDRIEQVFGKKLPLATLFAGPTIEQLSLAMQAEEERSSRTPIVAVQASGSRRPFFYMHGAWDSDAFYCFHLARHLGADQPFYALGPYNFTGLQAVPTMEEIAEAHIQSLRTVQPKGPYLLGGFCNGGLVAYEMARQLHAEGQRVDLLVLIEPAYSPVLHALAHSMIHRFGNMFRLSQEKQVEYFLRLRHMYKYIRHERRMENLKAFRNIDRSILTLLPTADALRQDDNALLDWIIAGYSYDLYPGEITLIWAREEPFRGVWRRKAAREKGIELRIVPGTHIGCRTDHVQELAEELSRCLGKAQTTGLKESEYDEDIPVSVD